MLAEPFAGTGAGNFPGTNLWNSLIRLNNPVRTSSAKLRVPAASLRKRLKRDVLPCWRRSGFPS